MTGTIKTVNLEKGYGFILAGGVEYFFHRSGLRQRDAFDSLHIGRVVHFSTPRKGRAPKTSPSRRPADVRA